MGCVLFHKHLGQIASQKFRDNEQAVSNQELFEACDSCTNLLQAQQCDH
jgi:hypothetical protein